MIAGRRASALYKALLSLGALTGILLQCRAFSGAPDLLVLRYYTLLSNVLCAAYFGAAAVCAARAKPTPLPRFKGALIMGITVTGMVYHFMLSGSPFSMGGAQGLANLLLHYVTPVGSVLDWLLFDRKGRYGKLAPVAWAALPDVYFVLATVYGFALGARFPFYGGSRFPYFFMDFDTLGAGGVAVYVLVMNVAFIALGYLFYFADRLMARAGSARGNRGAA